MSKKNRSRAKRAAQAEPAPAAAAADTSHLVPLADAMPRPAKPRKARAPGTPVPKGPRKSAFPHWENHTLNGLARWMGRSGMFTAETAVAAIAGIGLLNDGVDANGNKFKGIGPSNVRGAFYAGGLGKGKADATPEQAERLLAAAKAQLAAEAAAKAEPATPAPAPARKPRKGAKTAA